MANNFYYFSTKSRYSNGIVKNFLNSSPIIKSYGIAGNYRELYYDITESGVIAAGNDIGLHVILDLVSNYNSSVSFPGQYPHAITVYNSQIYVVKFLNANVAVISNGVLSNTFFSRCSTSLAGISVDSYGYFALSCQ